MHSKKFLKMLGIVTKIGGEDMVISDTVVTNQDLPYIITQFSTKSVTEEEYNNMSIEEKKFYIIEEPFDTYAIRGEATKEISKMISLIDGMDNPIVEENSDGTLILKEMFNEHNKVSLEVSSLEHFRNELNSDGTPKWIIEPKEQMTLNLIKEKTDNGKHDIQWSFDLTKEDIKDINSKSKALSRTSSLDFVLKGNETVVISKNQVNNKLLFSRGLDKTEIRENIQYKEISIDKNIFDKVSKLFDYKVYIVKINGGAMDGQIKMVLQSKNPPTSFITVFGTAVKPNTTKEYTEVDETFADEDMFKDVNFDDIFEDL